MTTRTIHTIALEILADWKRPYYAAIPYLAAMKQLGTMRDAFGYDDAPGIVARFLNNAQTWRGETAKRIKAELRQRIKDGI